VSFFCFYQNRQTKQPQYGVKNLPFGTVIIVRIWRRERLDGPFLSHFSPSGNVLLDTTAWMISTGPPATITVTSPCSPIRSIAFAGTGVIAASHDCAPLWLNRSGTVSGNQRNKSPLSPARTTLPRRSLGRVERMKSLFCQFCSKIQGDGFQGICPLCRADLTPSKCRIVCEKLGETNISILSGLMEPLWFGTCVARGESKVGL
jgi:hypothetical protein